jgi:alpha-mannosidase
MDHGLEILSCLRAKAFFQMVSSRKPAEKNEFPIFVYNPFPFDLEETIVCEFQAQEPNFDQYVFNQPVVTGEHRDKIQSQLEKESSNIQQDFRKRIVFRGMLKAASVNRFSCWLKKTSVPKKPIPQDEKFEFNTKDCKTVNNPVTGLIDEYVVQGFKILKSESFLPLVIKDDADPWGMRVRSFREIEGEFSLMSEKECGAFAGLPDLDPVRVIEKGPVRTVVEALFKYNNSNLCMRYKIPRSGAEIEIELRVFWTEKDRMLKLSIPTCFENGKCRGQVAYGIEEFNHPGEEQLAQKWLSVSSPYLDIAFTVVNNGTYGFDYEQGEIRLSLLRSPAYSAHPTDDNSPLVKQDRFEPRIDQGERTFTFWMNAGSLEDRFSAVDREAMVKNEGIMALCYFPPGKGKQVYPGVTLSDPVVQLKALKFAENKPWIIVRLFEPTGKSRNTSLKIPFLNIKYTVSLTGFEIKTIGIDMRSKSIFELDLLENYKLG